MVITELKTIEYIDFIKNIFGDNHFKFLLLSVVRYGDNKKYFQELEEYWSSIDNLTANNIVFLNFTTNSLKHKENYLDFGFGERIITKGIQPIKQYDLQKIIENTSYAGSYRRQAKKYNSTYFREQYFRELQSIKLKYLPKLKDDLNQTIDESATQLLSFLNKKERDVPFVYLFDLENEKEYFFSMNDIYTKYFNFYEFIKTLVVKIEREKELVNDSINNKAQITSILNNINLRKRRLLTKQKQLISIPLELKELENYLTNGNFNKKQMFYLESIIKRKNYELVFPLKNLFPNEFINNTHINSIILKYSNKDLTNLESNIQEWIEIETKVSHSDYNDLQKEILELQNRILKNTNQIKDLYLHIIVKEHSNNMRESNNFEIALTFAGENRNYVEQVATELELTLGKGKVFYDNFFQADLARLDLDVFLQDIYHNKSNFIVVFLSNNYSEKEWCGLEWRSIRDLIKRKEGEKIILVKMEDFNLDGIFSIDGYLSGISNNPEEISKLIIKRIGA
jgi:hypothetical protein